MGTMVVTMGGDACGCGSLRRLRLTPSGARFGAICDLEVTSGLTRITPVFLQQVSFIWFFFLPNCW